VGRFFATDPLESKYPWYSPYQFGGNSPIMSVELEGLEPSVSANIVESIKTAVGIEDEIVIETVTVANNPHIAKKSPDTPEFQMVAEIAKSVNNAINDYVVDPAIDTGKKVANVGSYFGTNVFNMIITYIPQSFGFDGFKPINAPTFHGSISHSDYGAGQKIAADATSLSAEAVVGIATSGVGNELMPLAKGVFKKKVAYEVVEEVIEHTDALVDDVFTKSDRVNHIIEGSANSNHFWEILSPSKNPEEIKDIIKEVLKKGDDVPYKRGQAKSLNVTRNGITREVQVPYFRGQNGEVTNFSSAFIVN
jgi:hypothetical protein